MERTWFAMLDLAMGVHNQKMGKRGKAYMALIFDTCVMMLKDIRNVLTERATLVICGVEIRCSKTTAHAHPNSILHQMSLLRILCASVNGANLDEVADENEAALKLALKEDWTNTEEKADKQFEH